MSLQSIKIILKGKIFLVNRLDKFWLRTEVFKPDMFLKFKTMERLHTLLVDYSDFIANLDDEETMPTFEEIFSSSNFFDYLKLVKNELKTVLAEITTTEELTGIFTGLIGHEMTFADNEGMKGLSYDAKENLMLHNLKLLDVAYQEQFQLGIPLPDDYREWINTSSFVWESYVRDLY